MLTLLANVPTSQSEDSQQCSWSDQECPGKLWYWFEHNCLDFKRAAATTCINNLVAQILWNPLCVLIMSVIKLKPWAWRVISGWKQWWLYCRYRSTIECQKGFPRTKYLTVGVGPFWEKGNKLLKCNNFISCVNSWICWIPVCPPGRRFWSHSQCALGIHAAG